MKSNLLANLAPWRRNPVDDAAQTSAVDQGSMAPVKGSMAFVYWWAAFTILQTLLVRLGTHSGYGITAFIDELGFATLFLGIFGILRLAAPQWLAKLIIFPTIVFLIVLTGGNQLYYTAFNNWAGLYSLGQINELGAIKSSVNSMLPYDVIILWFCVPLLMLIGFAKSWKKWQPRSAIQVLLAGSLLLGIGQLNRVNVTSPTENHLLLRALRLETARQVQRNAGYNPQKILEGNAMGSMFAPMQGYTRTGDAHQPLMQVPPVTKGADTRPNIIIIEAESFRSAESGVYGAKESLTPQFDRLSKQGVRAQNFYASGMQTVRGELAIHCSSYPALGDLPLYKRVPETDLTCLPDILTAAGYQNHWFSAFKSTYSGKKPFLETHGFQHIHGVETHGEPDEVHVGWGVSDEVMADRILTQLDKTEKPFLATWITLSNHHPWRWDYPLDFPADLAVDDKSETYDHYKRGIYYTDHAIGYFVDKIRERPWGKDAWIVIVGDHGMAMYPNNTERSEFGKREAHFRVPLLILAPGVLEPQIIERPASQVDIAPTLIDMMGIQVPNAFVGQSLLRDASAPASPVLMVGVNSASMVIDDKRCIASTYSCKEDETPKCADGESSRAANHVCFRQKADLLFNEDNGLELLSEKETAVLKRKLRVLPAMQTHLEAHNRLGGGQTWKDSLKGLAPQKEQATPESESHLN